MAPRRDLGAVAVVRADATASTVGEILEATHTDAFAVLHSGELVAEGYAQDSGPDRPHPVFSITKSLVGCVTGILLDRGALEESRPVEDYVPELGRSGYAGATVRDLLDMRSGVRFREQYDARDSDINLLDEWVRSGHGLYSYLTALEADQPHGGAFRYRSSETDALGWVCEQASGTSMDELIGDLVWRPMGAEHDAAMARDHEGTPVHDGGLAATPTDLLRFGRLLLDGGRLHREDGTTTDVLPPRWMRQGWSVDADIRGAFAASTAEGAFPGGWYRNQLWFRVGAFGDVALCLGIHGQLVYVGRSTGTVCVKLSSWPDAQNLSYLVDTIRACDAISGTLSGQAARGDVPWLPRVVSGLSRTGDGGRRPGSHVD